MSDVLPHLETTVEGNTDSFESLLLEIYFSGTKAIFWFVLTNKEILLFPTRTWPTLTDFGPAELSSISSTGIFPGALASEIL